MMIPESKKRLEAVYNDLRSYVVRGPSGWDYLTQSVCCLGEQQAYFLGTDMGMN